ncbi:uncharacterized protein LOC120447962 [Drosophila santomea]|uniref:uncharacterized protein LOC120447962 n=1 Tax=Drosophila santomea TaxID=129105 RepID=UPI0019543E7D|nr:uncharacterized protein LOC120447962 [Drosophila santomea]
MASQPSKAVVEPVGRFPAGLSYIFYIFPGRPHRCPLAIQATDHSKHIWKSGDMTGRMVESEIVVEISILASIRVFYATCGNFACHKRPQRTCHTAHWGKETETKIDILTCGLYRAVLQDSPPINYKWLHSEEVGQHSDRFAGAQKQSVRSTNWRLQQKVVEVIARGGAIGMGA